MASASSDCKDQRQLRLVELLDPEKYYPVLESLSSYLTLADSVALCQVCKGLDGLKNCMLKKISNINIHLQNFVDNPILFRSKIGSCNALISGPFALNVFELGHCKVRYLDVFVQDGINADQFTEYIQQGEEYSEERPDVETTVPRRIYGHIARPGIEFRITRTDGSPIYTILTSSYTTACLNLLTWNKAYSIFPQQTLTHHRFYSLRSVDTHFGATLRELSSQGWTTRDFVWPDLSKAFNTDDIRSVGDKYSLIIPLNTHSVPPPSLPDFSIEYAQFSVTRKIQVQFHLFRNQGQANSLSASHSALQNSLLMIRANKLTSPAIRHDYSTANSDWRNFVEDRLRRWTWLELYKLELEGHDFHPPNAIPLISDVSFPDGFEMPQAWDYADDQIPRWYQEWKIKTKSPW